jgi:ABC-2 type transport system permease protein
MRYLRLYLYFLRFSFSRAFEFRVDFWFRIVMDCVYYAVHLAFFAIIYARSGVVGGWTLDQTYVFVCGFLLADAIQMTVFANNLWMLPVFINRGDLDYYLVRPVSSLFFLSVREFAANSFVNVLIASGLLAWSLGRYSGHLGALQITVFLLFIVLGAFLTYLSRMLFVIPVFWLHSSRGLDELYYTMDSMAERPHQIFPRWLRWIVLSVLPLAFVSSVPSHVLFDGLTVERLVHAVLVTGGLFGLVLYAWRRGLESYASASS